MELADKFEYPLLFLVLINYLFGIQFNLVQPQLYSPMISDNSEDSDLSLNSDYEKEKIKKKQ